MTTRKDAESNFLTILTPTYNRGADGCLKNLYDSLVGQTEKNFIWLVVDDGSDDGTDAVVNDFKASAPFCIQYLRKENGGKHTALNFGIDRIKTPLTMIVDSDDALTCDAVETIALYDGRYRGEKGLCGFTFLRKFPDGRINGKQFEEDELVASYIDVRINGDDTKADKAEVFYTEVLKDYPFPEFEGEKFLGEDVVWIRMAKSYKSVHINKAIYVGDYLSGGLTGSRRAHNVSSPRGCMCRAEEFLCPEIKFKYRLKAALQYMVYGRFAGKKAGEITDGAPKRYKFLVSLCAFPGFIVYRKWRKSLK